VGSLGHGSILRAAPGADAALELVPAGANGMLSAVGLLADEATSTLRVCSSEAGANPDVPQTPTGIRAFDLPTGDARARSDFPSPEGSLCNDLALDSRSNLYATDSFKPRILRLPRGGAAVEAWLEDPRFLAGGAFNLNGIAIDSRDRVHVIMSSSGALYRVPVDAAGRRDHRDRAVLAGAERRAQVRG
jgi:hypothetical protein